MYPSSKNSILRTNSVFLIYSGTKTAGIQSNHRLYSMTNVTVKLVYHSVYLSTKPLGMQASITRCLSQARINWEGCSSNGIQRKNGERWRRGHWQSGWSNVHSKRTVGASAYVFFPSTIKPRRWWAIMEEVDIGCSEFCVTAGTLTRTASNWSIVG